MGLLLLLAIMAERPSGCGREKVPVGRAVHASPALFRGPEKLQREALTTGFCVPWILYPPWLRLREPGFRTIKYMVSICFLCFGEGMLLREIPFIIIIRRTILKLYRS